MVLRQVLQAIQADLTAHGAQVALAHAFPIVLASPCMLAQVLANLLSNAVKFVVPGSTAQVQIWAEQRETMVRLWIVDHGIGIAQADQERIFTAFERLHGPERYPGSGIGLAIVRQAVERMGGQVGVESAPGQGSRFWIELPVPCNPTVEDEVTVSGSAVAAI